jgi:ATP-dependent exoDNAse (exonuclease V) beta subunit
MQRTRNRTVEWVFDLPTETFYAEDQVLAAHVAVAQADACYEELAVLYVAMTRAKRAMYLITEPVGTAQSKNFPRLLQETLGEKWECGNADWFKGIDLTVVETRSEEEPTLVPATARVSRRPTRTPSATKSGEITGDRLFSLAGSGALIFGRAVHDMLAQVEWVEAKEAARFAEAWQSGGAASKEALACLRAPDLAEVWTKPVFAHVEVWRERPFEVVLDGAWVTGVFDRVVVCRDEKGQVGRVGVYDFKTDRGASRAMSLAAGRHAGQITLYRRVVAKLTGLSVAAVSAEVIFTETARKIAVNAGT